MYIQNQIGPMENPPDADLNNLLYGEQVLASQTDVRSGQEQEPIEQLINDCIRTETSEQSLPQSSTGISRKIKTDFKCEDE